MPDGALGGPDRHRGVRGDLPGELEGRGAVLAARYPPVDEPEPFRLVGADPASGQDEVRGPARTEPPRGQLRAAAAGHEADRHLRQSEHRRVVRHDQVAGQRQLAAAAEGEAVDCGDGRLRQRQQGAEHAAHRGSLAQDVGVGHGGPFLQIRPGAEGAFPGGTEHDRTDLGCGGDLGTGPGELASQLGTDRVQCLRAAEHDLGHHAAVVPRYRDRSHIREDRRVRAGSAARVRACAVRPPPAGTAWPARLPPAGCLSA